MNLSPNSSPKDQSPNSHCKILKTLINQSLVTNIPVDKQHFPSIRDCKLEYKPAYNALPPDQEPHTTHHKKEDHYEIYVPEWGTPSFK